MDNFDPKSMQEAMRLAGTPAGQQLIRHLQQSSGEDMQQAMNSAAAGDYEAAKKLLSQMLNTPEARKLMDQLGR